MNLQIKNYHVLCGSIDEFIDALAGLDFDYFFITDPQKRIDEEAKIKAHHGFAYKQKDPVYMDVFKEAMKKF